VVAAVSGVFGAFLEAAVAPDAVTTPSLPSVPLAKLCKKSGIRYSGKTAQVYTVTASDVGSTIRVAVTATSTVGSVTAVSSATAVVVVAP
jgi:hypothetical protein